MNPLWESTRFRIVILVTFAMIICYLKLTIKGPLLLQDDQGDVIRVGDNTYKARNQEDPGLIRYIRTLMIPPSTKPYNLREPKRKHFTSMEQSRYVGEMYGPGKREDCFFVEVGAFNGEGSSSSLYLERELGFRGLLIEANNINFKALRYKNRKAYLLHAAVSPNKTSAELSIRGSGQQGRISLSNQGVKTKAFPFYSIMKSLNISFVDVLNLDIEGFELKVLKTIAHDKLKFGVLIIEHFKIPEPKAELIDFMKKQGYDLLHSNYMDYIFGDQKYLNTLPGWPKKQ